MALRIEARGDAVRILVRAIPRSRRAGVQGEHDGALKVGLASPPLEGRANRELCAMLAKLLGIAPSNVCVMAGQRGRLKWVEVVGLDEAAVRERLGHC